MTTLKPLLKQSSVNDKWVATCKICRLIITDPEIWIEFHKNYEDGWKMSTLIDWINTKVPEINEGRPEPDHLVEFNRENLTRHLKGLKSDGTTGHCRDFLACKNQIEHGGHSKEFKKAAESIVINPEVFEASDRILANVQEKMTEFLSLMNMVDSLDRILLYYDHTLKERMERQDSISIEEIENYQKQVSCLVKLKQDMSKLRNTSKVAGDAVQASVELIVVTFLQRLIPITDEARDVLKSEYPNSSLPDEVISTILSRISDAMKEAIPVVLKKVLSEYKIK